MSDRVLIWLLFEQDGGVLLTRRKAKSAPFGSYWTLPGDLMRAEESASETVRRFARAELDVEIAAEEFVDTFYLNEGSESYAVTVFKPASFTGRLRYRESGPYAEASWALPLDLPSPLHAELAELLRGKRHWQPEESKPAGGAA